MNRLRFGLLILWIVAIAASFGSLVAGVYKGHTLAFLNSLNVLWCFYSLVKLIKEFYKKRNHRYVKDLVPGKMYSRYTHRHEPVLFMKYLPHDDFMKRLYTISEKEKWVKFSVMGKDGLEEIREYYKAIYVEIPP